MTTGLTVRRALGSAALLVYVAFPAWSDTGLDRAADADALQSIVITATRIPTAELDLASSVTVVTAEEIAARQERTFAEVLKNIPGSTWCSKAARAPRLRCSCVAPIPITPRCW